MGHRQVSVGEGGRRAAQFLYFVGAISVQPSGDDGEQRRPVTGDLTEPGLVLGVRGGGGEEPVERAFRLQVTLQVYYFAYFGGARSLAVRVAAVWHA
jgi:hypothetical protein